MVAVKSLKGDTGLASLKVATVWLPLSLPSVAETVNPPVAVNAASATLPVLVAEAVLPPTSVMLTVIVYEPSSA